MMHINNTFIIAEIGVNHNGSIDLAMKHIQAAKLSGADAVKFQTFNADRLVSHGTPKVEYQSQTTAPNETHFEMIRRLELPYDQHFPLKEFAENLGMAFISTPYDLESAKFLHEKLDIKILKVASADIVDHPLLTYLKSTNKDVILAAGMATENEIRSAINIFGKCYGERLSILHCVSNYPCSHTSLNLNVIKSFKDAFGEHKVGFSDHSIGYEAAMLSIALGARVVEKHFTLDKTLPGPDHKASSNPTEFRELVQKIRLSEKMLGSDLKGCQPEESQMRSVSRKSFFYKQDLQKGTKLKGDHLELLRPGTGFLGCDLDKIINKKLCCDVRGGTMVSSKHISL